MSWLEKKYAAEVGLELQRYSVKSRSPFVANFRCPECGDSRKSRHKARGYFYEHHGRIGFSCKNCGSSRSLLGFLRQNFPKLASRMSFEALSERRSEEREAEQPSVEPEKLAGFDEVPLASKLYTLPTSHTAWRYTRSRMVPDDVAAGWWHAECFYAAANAVKPDKFSDELVARRDHPRLVIPFISGGEIVAIQGRSYDEASAAKYITVRCSDRTPLYNRDGIDSSRTVYLTEGPIDSVFLKNGAAFPGGSIHSWVKALGESADASDAELARSARFAAVYDNEPRSEHTVRKMLDAVDAGLAVCVWPGWVGEKDVNDMVLSGTSPERVAEIVEECEMDGERARIAIVAGASATAAAPPGLTPRLGSARQLSATRSFTGRFQDILSKREARRPSRGF